MTGIEDVSWGDVVSDDDGVLVVKGEAAGTPVVVKRFASPFHRREIAIYELLGVLGVPTLPVIGAGDDWLILEDMTSAGYRRATAADLTDAAIVRLIAQWYARLHTAGGVGTEAITYSEFDLIDAHALSQVAHRWPDLEPVTHWATTMLGQWADQYRAARHTLTHNDFSWTNLAIAWDASSACMFDYNLLGSGLPESDVRNVTAALPAAMAAEFGDEYWRLMGAAGVAPSPEAVRLDDATSNLVALIMASEHDPAPAWADGALAWARAQDLR